MKTLEYFENLAVKTHIEPDSVIPYRDDAIMIPSLRENFDSGVWGMPGKLEGVIDQIAKRNRKCVRVCIDMKIVDFDRQMDVTDYMLELAQ